MIHSLLTSLLDGNGVLLQSQKLFYVAIDTHKGLTNLFQHNSPGGATGGGGAGIGSGSITGSLTGAGDSGSDGG